MSITENQRKVAFSLSFTSGVVSAGLWAIAHSATEQYISDLAVAVAVLLSIIGMVSVFANWSKLMWPISLGAFGACIGTFETYAVYDIMKHGYHTMSGKFVPLRHATEPMPGAGYAITGAIAGCLIYLMALAIRAEWMREHVHRTS